MKNILVVDDNLTICLMLKSWLVKHGYNVEAASNVADAIDKIKIEAFDLVLSDIRMPDADGFSLLSWIKKYDSSVQVIMMTSFADIESAVESIKMGAFDYIAKPIDADALFQKIEEAFKRSEIAKRSDDLHQNFFRPKGLDIQANHDKMIEAISKRLHLLIIGNNGTGKSTAAKFIYIKGTQIYGSFIEIDLEEPNFVTEKLTDDVQLRIHFEKAKGGLLYIKGLKKPSIHFQNILLDLLTKQNKDDDYTQIIISTTQTKDDIKEQLMPKLANNILNSYIELPSIGGNKEAIVSFSDAFVKMANRELNKNITSISPKVYEFLYKQKWEGNIQELKNIIFKIVLMTEGSIISEEAIPLIVDKSRSPNDSRYTYDKVAGIDSFKKENFEKRKISEALDVAKGNKTLAATMLNIDRKTLYNKIRLYGI